MNVQELAAVLMELRNSSISLGTNPSDESIRGLIEKYNIMFGGSRLNVIYSNELCHYVNSKLNAGISLETLNQAIPDLCIALGMSCEPMVNVKDISTPTRSISQYQITLF